MRVRRAWLAGGVVVLAVLVIARIDLTHTENQIPPFPPQGESTLPRYEEIQRLDRDFDRRAWAYGGVAAVAMGIATAVALSRSSTLEEQRRVFSEAGVAGVVLGVAGVALLWTLRGIEPPLGAVFAPCLMLLAVAALGGGAARLPRPPPAERGEVPEDRGLKRVAVAALLCTAATIVFAYAYAGQQDGSCDTPSTENTWTTLAAWAAIVTTIAAVVLGLTGLAARRWFVALICLVVNPAALLYMLLSSGVLC